MTATATISGVPARRKDWRGLATAGALIALFYMVMVGLHPFTDPKTTGAIPGQGSGDVVQQLWYTAALVVVVAASQPFAYPRRLLVLPMPLVLALGWCALSLTWALAPEIGLRRLILTVMIIFILFRGVDQLGGARAAMAVRVALAGVLAFNYFAMVVSPVAVHQNTELLTTDLAGAWRGAFHHKNFAGPAAAGIVILFVFDARRVPSWAQVGVIAAAAYFLYRTESKTSMALLALSLAAGAAYLRYSPRFRAFLLPAVLVAGAVIAYVAIARWDEMNAVLYDQAAFTGRTQIWRRMLLFLADRPMTGAGFGSFWNIGVDNPIAHYGKGWVTEVGNAHQGYIDLASQIGVPGLVLAVLALVIAPIARLLTAAQVDRPRGALAMALLVFCAGHNFTETSMLDRDAIVETLLMLGVALTYQATRRNGGSGDRPRAPRIHTATPAAIGMRR